MTCYFQHRRLLWIIDLFLLLLLLLFLLLLFLLLLLSLLLLLPDDYSQLQEIFSYCWGLFGGSMTESFTSLTVTSDPLFFRHYQGWLRHSQYQLACQLQGLTWKRTVNYRSAFKPWRQQPCQRWGDGRQVVAACRVGSSLISNAEVSQHQTGCLVNYLTRNAQWTDKVTAGGSRNHQVWFTVRMHASLCWQRNWTVWSWINREAEIRKVEFLSIRKACKAIIFRLILGLKNGTFNSRDFLQKVLNNFCIRGPQRQDLDGWRSFLANC